MASFDGTLQVAGASMQVVAFLLGAVAERQVPLPRRERVMRWIRKRATVRAADVAALVLVMVVWLLLLALTFVPGVSDAAVVIVAAAVLVALVLLRNYVNWWIGFFVGRLAAEGRPTAESSGENFQRSLKTLAAVFGTGVVLHLIAAATP